MAAGEQVEDHVDEFFVDLVLMGLARGCGRSWWA